MKNSKSKRQNSIRQLAGKIMREMLEMRETFEALNIIRLKRFKPQTFQASSFKADPVRTLADSSE